MRPIDACLAASALFFSTSADSAPPTVPVNVVNTNAHAVPTTIVNTPTVAISGTPTVNVANLPGGGTLYQEALGVTINVPGGVSGAPSSAVPAGKRRIITVISGRVACTAGHGALVQVFANVGIFLPMQFAYNDSMGRSTYAMMSNLNFTMAPGSQMYPIIESDGSTCQADIFLSGVEVPEQP